MVQRKFKLKIKQVIEAICDSILKPRFNSDLEDQILYGKKIKIINKEHKQWVSCQSINDNYNGYIKKNNLGDLAIEKFFETRNKIENSYNKIIEFKKLI